MLTGAAAQVIYYNVGSTYGGMLPADWEGPTQPPSGAPCPFAEWDDSAWIAAQRRAAHLEFPCGLDHPRQLVFRLCFGSQLYPRHSER